MKITMIGTALAYYHNCYNTFELRSSKNEVTKDRIFTSNFFLEKLLNAHASIVASGGAHNWCVRFGSTCFIRLCELHIGANSTRVRSSGPLIEYLDLHSFWLRSYTTAVSQLFCTKRSLYEKSVMKCDIGYRTHRLSASFRIRTIFQTPWHASSTSVFCLYTRRPYIAYLSCLWLSLVGVRKYNNVHVEVVHQNHHIFKK